MYQEAFQKVKTFHIQRGGYEFEKELQEKRCCNKLALFDVKVDFDGFGSSTRTLYYYCGTHQEGFIIDPSSSDMGYGEPEIYRIPESTVERYIRDGIQRVKDASDPTNKERLKRKVELTFGIQIISYV